MVFGLVLPTEHSWDPDMPEYSDPDFVWLVTMATACAVALAGLGAAVGFALGKVARVFFVVLLILYGWRLGVLIPHFSE
ncbi:hypothetical protein [Nonomuraea endophytica]|uniref:Uncharacterized protein n=1 Tax=Nonomuraea endophytica TaxID=714136 RepID=A0A7W8A6G8_9ACTN|nr:hypothetical protein [Nonomuraea endophytica]MBB5079551.1 hypothetical protein [Nonomuraea endophytica]